MWVQWEEAGLGTLEFRLLLAQSLWVPTSAHTLSPGPFIHLTDAC